MVSEMRLFGCRYTKKGTCKGYGWETETSLNAKGLIIKNVEEII